MQFIKKCLISRTNIINFDTLTLYQNISYKMVEAMRLELTHQKILPSEDSASTCFAMPPLIVVIIVYYPNF